MTNNRLLIPSHDDAAFPAYMALPEHGPGPGIVLIHYICGVNRVMRQLADDLAAQGYCVVVPDLYWRQGDNIALIDDPARPDPAEQQRALALNEGFDDGNGILDLEATVAWLRTHPQCNGKVGVLGYCLGGRLAFVMATRSNVDCAVSYYGVRLEEHLHHRLKAPTLCHVAGQDYLVQAPTRAAIVGSLQADPLATVTVHGGVSHAFALPGGQNYATSAAQMANEASAAFLRHHLLRQ